MSTELIVPFLSLALSGVGAYTYFHFTRYQACRDQAQKVRRTMEDVLTDTAGLFSRNAPARALKSELPAILTSLSRETRRLSDMTARLPLKRLQREQGHVLRHAVSLIRYLDSHMADNEGEFFLFLHDVALGGDREVSNIMASLHSGAPSVTAADTFSWSRGSAYQ